MEFLTPYLEKIVLLYDSYLNHDLTVVELIKQLSTFVNAFASLVKALDKSAKDNRK